ncbi:40S ribosomal protein S30-B [Hypsizygus marmoreus]|uniref:40S ribosomal protein S30-B n=1 Tax=Hypsizygus marmoreus TaxID=39966 RepID=A0A369J386_HYPMA|nr:40S ribosomal protein S30-B [Hypsizygus marmoreus]
MGKVHGSLARAGKVKSQTPKVEKQEKKKTPKGRAKKRILYNRRLEFLGSHSRGDLEPTSRPTDMMIHTEYSIVHTESQRVDKHASKVFRSYLISSHFLPSLIFVSTDANELQPPTGTPTPRSKKALPMRAMDTPNRT